MTRESQHDEPGNCSSYVCLNNKTHAALGKLGIHALKEPLSTFGDMVGGITLILTGIAIIFVAITIMGKLMKSPMVGRAKHILKSAIGRGPIHGIASGTLVTVLVQSSSTTTSLMVPLVGTGVLKVKEVYPFTLGANIGTCITALLAATAVSGEFAVFALQIALVHLILWRQHLFMASRS